jgi:uncharacterized protein (UPF0264 family)
MELVDRENRGPLPVHTIGGGNRARTGLLASVRSVDEARLVQDEGADIIDLKEPGNGALGGLSSATIESILAALPASALTSATIGDFEGMRPQAVRDAALRVAATGVDIVKVGFFPAPESHACIELLGRDVCPTVRVVAVLFADLGVDSELVDAIAAAGFFGVMLDTARKASGSLTHHLSLARLGAFVEAGQTRELMTGLAGSLRTSDVTTLLQLGPDYLGFRGALCSADRRAGTLERARVAAVRALIPRPELDAENLMARAFTATRR